MGFVGENTKIGLTVMPVHPAIRVLPEIMAWRMFQDEPPYVR